MHYNQRIDNPNNFDPLNFLFQTAESHACIFVLVSHLLITYSIRFIVLVLNLSKNGVYILKSI